MIDEHALLQATGAVGVSAALVPLLARRLRLSPVLLYLLAGMLAGPAVLGIVQPDRMHGAFTVAVELAVALIVFEGAFTLELEALVRMGRVLRNLLTFGVVATLITGTLLVVGLGVLPWQSAMLFGALIVVTGPTVIAPLLKRTRLNERTHTTLHSEAILIDPIGAILAVVVLEVVLSGLTAKPLLALPLALGIGAAAGIAGASTVVAVFRVYREPSPSEASLLLLGASVGVFAIAEHLYGHSGLVAMVVMGVALSSAHVPNGERIKGFQDDLAQISIAGVYILATATVEPSALRSLWPSGFVVVFLLIVVVRPAVVWVCTWGSDMNWQERIFVGLVGPRGVVAAALAAFSGERLGIDLGGERLIALIFLTILMTVALQLSYAGPLARLLGVEGMRAVIADAGSTGRQLAHQLVARGYAVMLVENDPDAVSRARTQGLDVIGGDCTNTKTLQEARAAEADLAIATTGSDESNLLFSQFIRAHGTPAEAFSLVTQSGAVEAFEHAGVHVMERSIAAADALLGMMGEPTLSDALSDERGDRIAVEAAVGWNIAGKRLREIRLPQHVLAVLIRRDEAGIIPDGSTILLRGDRVVLFGASKEIAEARSMLQ